MVATGGAAGGAAAGAAAATAGAAAAAACLTLPFDFSFSFFDGAVDDCVVVAVAAAAELLPDELLLLPFDEDTAAVEGDPLLFRWLLLGRLEEVEFCWAVSGSTTEAPPAALLAFLFVLLGPEGFELVAEEEEEESLRAADPLEAVF